MELSLDALLQLVQGFGLPGVVFIIWYFGEKSHAATLARYREDVRDMKAMYEKNVELVRQVTSLAEAHQAIVVMNTQALQRLCDDVTSNQFCPMIRLKKSIVGAAEE